MASTASVHLAPDKQCEWGLITQHGYFTLILCKTPTRYATITGFFVACFERISAKEKKAQKRSLDVEASISVLPVTAEAHLFAYIYVNSPKVTPVGRRPAVGVDGNGLLVFGCFWHYLSLAPQHAVSRSPKQRLELGQNKARNGFSILKILSRHVYCPTCGGPKASQGALSRVWVGMVAPCSPVFGVRNPWLALAILSHTIVG